MSPNRIPNTPATEASSQPSDNHCVEFSPMSTVTMSPALTTTRSLQQRKHLEASPVHEDSNGIDIPPLGKDNNVDAGAMDEAPLSSSSPPASPMRLSGLLPYKRGPSIPNMTSFTPTQGDEAKDDARKEVDVGAVEEKEEQETNTVAKISANDDNEISPLVFVDDGSTTSVQSPCKGGLEALIQEKVDEDSESVRHIVEAVFVIKLDETRHDVMKFLDAKAGQTTSAAYFYPEVGTYNGEFCDGLPHGIGSFFWLDGSNYSGNWDEGEPEGDGKLILPTGEMFVRCAESNEIIHLPPQNYAKEAEAEYEVRRKEPADEVVSSAPVEAEDVDKKPITTEEEDTDSIISKSPESTYSSDMPAIGVDGKKEEDAAVEAKDGATELPDDKRGEVEAVEPKGNATRSPQRSDLSVLESGDAGKYKGQTAGGVPHGLGSSK